MLLLLNIEKDIAIQFDKIIEQVQITVFDKKRNKIFQKKYKETSFIKIKKENLKGGMNITINYDGQKEKRRLKV